MSLVYFLGRFHVVVLHLPIGIVLMAIAVELLARRKRFENLDALTPVLWLAATVTAVLTALLGLMHVQEGIAGASVGLHRAYGLAFVATVAGVWALRSWRPAMYRTLQLPLAAALIVLVTLTGHQGGNITHGSSYLMEYAPEPLRSLAGLEPLRPAVTDLARADVYLDVVQPIFKGHCAACHNDDRTKGGLSLSRLDRLKAGGRDGAVVVPGNAQASDLYRRVTLPVNHEDFMPAEGKPPLSENETRVLAWWIDAGLPSGKTVGALTQPPPENVRTAMLQVVGLAKVAGADARDLDTASSGESVDADGRLPQVPPASAETLTRLTALGFVIRPVAIGSPLLDVEFTKGQALTLPALESLLAIKDQVSQLNLRAAGLNDSHLRLIGKLTRLQHLRVELNDVTDKGVAALSDLTELRSLNLYGTQVTDASLEPLGKMRSLQDVYVFRTKVSERALAQLGTAGAKPHLHGGSSLITAIQSPAR